MKKLEGPFSQPSEQCYDKCTGGEKFDSSNKGDDDTACQCEQTSKGQARKLTTLPNDMTPPSKIRPAKVIPPLKTPLIPPPWPPPLPLCPRPLYLPPPQMARSYLGTVG